MVVILPCQHHCYVRISENGTHSDLRFASSQNYHGLVMSKIFAMLRQIKYLFIGDLEKQSLKPHDFLNLIEKLNVKEQAILKSISETKEVEKIEDLRRDLKIIDAQRRKGWEAIHNMSNAEHK
ncbi:hypothetical protein [Methylomarinum vadi]|uniref:hypothetical protein n=1 Tax=Methylomarinum vadi TaxID=438855 RepID=UPI001268355E|nr:hypothetical protein [Methylomarinum vadi]